MVLYPRFKPADMHVTYESRPIDDGRGDDADEGLQCAAVRRGRCVCVAVTTRCRSDADRRHRCIQASPV